MEFRVEHAAPGSVRIFGEVDVATAPELQSSLTSAIQESQDLVVDLSGVEFMDSTGVRVLISVSKALGERGRGKLVFVHVPKVIARLFEIVDAQHWPNVVIKR